MKKYWSLFVMLLLFGSTAFLLSGCKEKEKATPADPATGPLMLHDNVLVVDSTKHHLDPSPALLAAGTYRFISNSAALGAKVGTIIVGAQGLGFLRKVTAVTSTGNLTTCQTQQASLDDVFSGGTLKLHSSSDSLRQYRVASNGGFNYTVGNTALYQNGILNLSLLSGQVSMNPDWVMEFSFGPTGITHAKVSTDGSFIDGNMVFNATVNKAFTLPTQTKRLAQFQKRFIVWVDVVPVVVVMNVDLDLQYSASFNAAYGRDATFMHHSTLAMGVEYLNGAWTSVHTFTPANTVTLGAASGNINANVQLAYVPNISFKLYNALGPYASVGMESELQANLGLPSHDWDFTANTWLQGTVGAKGSILGHQLGDFSETWSTTKTPLYQTPDHLRSISGDNQTGSANKALPIPLKVRVLDSQGGPQSKVKVYFTPKAAGNGSASPDTIRTDADGYAQTTWTLGPATTPIQYLNVKVNKADGSPIAGSPLDFAAFADNCGGSQTLQIDSVTAIYFPGTPIVNIYPGYGFWLSAKGGMAPFKTMTNLVVNSASGTIAYPVDVRTILNCSQLHYCALTAGDVYNNATYSLTFTITDAKGVSLTQSKTWHF